MKPIIHQPHDKFFKANLKEKKIAIDFLKAYLPKEIYKCIDIDTLKLTEKSFIVPELQEIHSDIIYQCEINQKSGYLFFLVEHGSTANYHYVFIMGKFLLTLIRPIYMITLKTLNLPGRWLSNHSSS